MNVSKRRNLKILAARAMFFIGKKCISLPSIKGFVIFDIFNITHVKLFHFNRSISLSGERWIILSMLTSKRIDNMYYTLRNPRRQKLFSRKNFYMTFLNLCVINGANIPKTDHHFHLFEIERKYTSRDVNLYKDFHLHRSVQLTILYL